VIQLRRHEFSHDECEVAEEVSGLWEEWMRHADRVLDDSRILEVVYTALAGRWPNSRTRGRKGTPAEVVLRLLVLKHIRNWSFAVVEREVRANLLYRQFTGVGTHKVPDAKTLGKIGVALGPQVIEKIHQRVVAIALEKKIVGGRTMRVDTTVVETDIHHPTDSTLLGDGVRVLTRAMKSIQRLAGASGTKLRDRKRSTRHCLINIGRASRSRVPQGKQRMQQSYGKLLGIVARVVGQAQRYVNEVASGVKRSDCILKQAGIEAQREYLQLMIPRVQQVMRQTRERIFKGNSHSHDKLVSLFEAHTEIIRKGKASKPTEFGKMVKIQEAEKQIVTHYEVYDQRPSDSDLLIPALDIHERQFGHPAYLVAADAGFFSQRNEEAAHARGVKRVSIPNRSTKSAQRKRHEKQRWFRNGQKWRTGAEGRISLLKRRHGLNRCRYKGPSGIKRWVGLGVIADNLINIGRALAASADKH
jgi:transposase, IS5 family